MLDFRPTQANEREGLAAKLVIVNPWDSQVFVYAGCVAAFTEDMVELVAMNDTSTCGIANLLNHRVGTPKKTEYPFRGDERYFAAKLSNRSEMYRHRVTPEPAILGDFDNGVQGDGNFVPVVRDVQIFIVHTNMLDAHCVPQ
jgi:hypothetical protein